MRRNYYIFNNGELKRENFNVVLKTAEKKTIIPIETIDDLFIYSKVSFNSDLICYLGKRSINVYFYDFYSNYRATLTGVESQISGNTHVKQVQHYLDKTKRLYLVKEFLKATSETMKNILDLFNVNLDNVEHLKKIEENNNINKLMGLEGNFKKSYYEKFDLILTDLKFEKRTKQPPKNEVNVLISFGNTMVYNYCLKALKETYLDSTISFLHEPGDRRHSLSLDLAELFKPIFVDKVIFKLVNEKIITLSDFISDDDNFCLIKESGKKIFIKAIEEELKKTFFHPTLKRSITYEYLIKLECYKLCKHVLNVSIYKPYIFK